MNRRDEQVRALIAHEAGDWFVAHRAGALDSAARRAFEAWITASPIHVEEYLGVAVVARLLPAAAHDPEMTIQSVLERVRHSDAVAVSSLGNAATAPKEIGPRTAAVAPSRSAAAAASLAALAASLLVAAITLHFWSGDRTAPQLYATRHGELRTWHLADNSVLSLDTDTAVTVRFAGAERVVELNHGQAFFEVAHDARRRFRVIVGNVVVTAVGTKFDVDRRADSSLVTVVQGQVAVSAATAATGAASDVARWTLRVGEDEQLRVVGDAVPEPPAPARTARATAWLRRQIVIEREPLGAVAAELNRYSARPVVIETPTLKSLLISGVFSTDDSDTFVAFLRTLDGVTVLTTPTQIRVLAPAAARPRETAAPR